MKQSLSPSENNNLYKQALNCLQIKDPAEKITQVNLLQEQWLQGDLTLEELSSIISLPEAGHPDKPELVSPKLVSRRNFTTLKGKLSLVHAIAHIEFNAINLALDAVYRFQSMPEQYYSDWCKVAVEEAEHFSLLNDYLLSHGMQYGDLDAHNGLWEMACKTDFDVMVRMALVPRVLEARGLDVTPGMIKKLKNQPDDGLVEILQKIFDEEIGHVKIGSHWFNLICEQRNLVPDETFSHLLDTYMKGSSFGPFEFEAREQAGFSKKEMQDLMSRM